MRIRCGTVALALVAVGALVVAPGAAQAQITWSSAGEVGGDDVNLIFTSLGWTPGWMGIRPTLGVSAYRVGTEGGDIYSFGPSVGLEYRASGGSLEVDVGYSFKNSDASSPFFGGSEDGATTGVHAEYWGDGTWGLQGIGSYNWGSEYLWSRGRVTRRVVQLDPGSLNLGAQAVWQGQTGDEPNPYRVTQYGPVVQWITGTDWILAGSAGWKNIEDQDDTWYAGLEIVYTP